MAATLTWQGLGRTINKFRKKQLGLDSISLASGASVLDRLKIPYLYCWNAELIPKPRDWMQNIDITGFLFLDSDPGYRPPDDLARFLAASGPPPVYIGFGSIVVDDPVALTRLLLEAIRLSGVRALLSAGWSKMGGQDIPENVFLLVPFFGDQPFWGAMIANRGAGPEPLPFKTLTAEKLAVAFEFALSDKARAAAAEVGTSIRREDGAANFAQAFHAHLPLLHMRCDLDSNRVAVWWSDKYALRLSALATQVLIDTGKIKKSSLETWRPSEYATGMPATDPVSGGAVAVLSAVTEFGEGFFRMFTLKPQKGLLMMVTAPPKAVVKMLTELTEGKIALYVLSTLPFLYGTKERRPRTKVKDAGSGFVAGGKGLAFGFYDGITGMVLDPMKGAQSEGVVGFAKGFARASVNLTVQPAAGMFGLFSHPVKGIGKSISNALRPELGEVVLQQPRYAMGLQEVKLADEATKQDMIRQFDQLAKTVDERKKMLKDEAKRWMREVEKIAARAQEVEEVVRQPSNVHQR